MATKRCKNCGDKLPWYCGWAWCEECRRAGFAEYQAQMPETKGTDAAKINPEGRKA